MYMGNCLEMRRSVVVVVVCSVSRCSPCSIGAKFAILHKLILSKSLYTVHRRRITHFLQQIFPFIHHQKCNKLCFLMTKFDQMFI